MPDNTNNDETSTTAINSGKNRGGDSNMSDDVDIDIRNTITASLDLVQQLNSDLAPPLPVGIIDASQEEEGHKSKRKIAAAATASNSTGATSTTTVGATDRHNEGQVTSTISNAASYDRPGNDRAIEPQRGGPIPIHFYSVEAVAVPDGGDEDEEAGRANAANRAETTGDEVERQLSKTEESERTVYQATLVTAWYKDPKKIGCFAILLCLIGAAIAIGVVIAPSSTTNAPPPASVTGEGVQWTTTTMATAKAPAETEITAPVTNVPTVTLVGSEVTAPVTNEGTAPITTAPTISPMSPSDVRDWHAEHTIPSSSYQAHFDEWLGKGYILRLITGFQGADGEVYFNTIWHKNAQNVVWIAHHGVTENTHQDFFDEHTADGYRLVFVDGYDVDGIPRMNSIYEYDSDSSITWLALHGQSQGGYQATFEHLVGAGYRPDIVSTYQSSGTPRYASIFSLHSNSNAWVARHGITSARFQTVFNGLTSDGYSLEYISVGSQDGEEPLFSCIFVNIPGRIFQAYHDIIDVQAKIDQWETLGYMPTVIDGYKAAGSTVRYSLLLQKLED